MSVAACDNDETASGPAIVVSKVRAIRVYYERVGRGEWHGQRARGGAVGVVNGPVARAIGVRLFLLGEYIVDDV